MSVVSIAEAWPAPGKPFIIAELDRMPNDGHRYELIDGVNVVSPWPGNPHARVSGDEAFAAVRPFPVEVVPSRLVAGLQPV